MSCAGGLLASDGSTHRVLCTMPTPRAGLCPPHTIPGWVCVAAVSLGIAAVLHSEPLSPRVPAHDCPACQWSPWNKAVALADVRAVTSIIISSATVFSGFFLPPRTKIQHNGKKSHWFSQTTEVHLLLPTILLLCQFGPTSNPTKAYSEAKWQ